MKNFQQNLLVFLALCLCGLCAYQWYFATIQRDRLDQLNQAVYEKATAIQGYTNNMHTMDVQIGQMDQQITLLRQTAKTNDQMLLTQKRQIARLESSSEILTNEVTQYKSALDEMDARLKTAYDGIAKQNEAVKQLVAQRDEFLRKYNDSVKDRNALVIKYNDLVERVAKLQSNTAAAKP
jgi:chromosome segregation ATPase